MDWLTEIYSSFEPFKPSSKETYVECETVRGGWAVERELGRKITRSKEPTCQLYSGHRGVGKSTELLRLKEYLEKHKYFVVYFAADEQDIETEDADYAEILFACTRHLVEAVKLEKEHNPLLRWMETCWNSLKDLALTEVSFQDLKLEVAIAQFAKIATTIRTVPDKRREFRQRLNANVPSLLEALNEFIVEAQKFLQERNKDCKGIVLIADNLDRIAETRTEKGKYSNYDEIYINRSYFLASLNCHVIYTVPIPMIYTARATQLVDIYGRPDVLPMVMVCNPDGSENKEGLEKLKELICRRIMLIDPRLVQTLDGPVAGVDVPAVFDSPETIKQLCLMSGGHVRNLMQLIQKAIDWTDELPITMQAAKRAISEVGYNYQLIIQDDQWEVLARIYYEKHLTNDVEYLRLLLNRCILEYRYYNLSGELNTWVDIHPLIKYTSRFSREISNHKLQQKYVDEIGNNIDLIVKDRLNEIATAYKYFLDKEEYANIAKIAEEAYQMLTGIVKSLDQESPTYHRLIALAEYYRHTKNLYAVRSASDVSN